MMKPHTPSFTVTLECSLKPSERRFLDARSNAAASIYNDCLGQCIKRVHKIQHDRRYQALLGELKKAGDDEDAARPVRKGLGDIRSYYGFTEYDIHGYVISAKHHFGSLGIDECQKLATRAFQAAEKLLYGKAGHVRYVPRGDDITIEGKSSKSTLKYIGGRKIQFGAGHVFGLMRPRNGKDLAYVTEALAHRVKYARLMRLTIRGRQRYYAQLVLEGAPPGKGRTYGPHVPVGIDEGVSTVAVSSGNYVKLHELAPGCRPDEKAVRRLQRAMDRSRRAANPDNYNEDGTIRKGKKTWVKSGNYRKLQSRYRDANRALAAKRRQEHEMLANEILSVGTDIRIEAMSMKGLQKRSSKDHKDRHGRNLTKKRFGRTILSRAPAEFVTILERKLKYRGLVMNKTDTFALKASQYDHVTDTYTKKQLRDRLVEVGGRIVQRDMYSAFLLEHAPDDTIDGDSCARDFDIFCLLCSAEIERIRSSENKSLLWYVS